MPKTEYLRYRVEPAFKKKVLAHAKKNGFKRETEYLAHLVDQDLGEEAGRPPGGASTNLGGDLQQGDLILALNQLDRKLDRYLGLTSKSTKVNSHYEKLRNAVVALGLFQNDPARLKAYLMELFKGEMEG
ncbi:MAG: hypothetical protein A2527_10145 [Candidatus Lambdaproteobacteria bacterium RIFOXYD2_FULL_50_16]|uniref:Uncharacterized protein n=1 Tax=Candidatus Lambdaproteobacteria bacterium RIFOXYD2_FULL_50_16 TaxID=1817772 RepID=A0A1F6GAC1_9PROT|nr:MAG: hypothetical protein A2527_10145 [Candidatus Lambdaproteobacteria bacterium RIFOXYD2_FULL_50_16]